MGNAIKERVAIKRRSDVDRPDIVTTGYAARIMKAAPRTVSKWVDEGLLKGYRLPGSMDRRIHRADLIDFMLTRHMFRDLGVVKLNGPWGLREARVTEREGRPVVRVGATEDEPAEGFDLDPEDSEAWEIKSASDGVMFAMAKAGYRFADGR